MITKGILKAINYNENSCTVRIPLFETTSSTNEVVLPAIFLTQPGSYNGYSEGDVVFVDFENNSLSSPIIIGKLYLGAIKEKATSKKGGLTIADLSVTSSATLPLDTKLTFNAADETVASVEGGYNTYKSLLDIIKALYKTETSVSKTTEEALENITKIKVEYLSQLVTDPEPLKEDPNWSISMPNYKDGYNIWQKTTCYNSKGQILSTEIICLSAANAIASYWLRCSTKIHSGTQQAETIEITAMTKLGTSPETADEESSLTYRWSKGADKKPEVADPETPYKLIFRNTAEAPLPNENLIITAYRNGTIYESETIFFSPLNTPTLVLTNENASLEYDSYGFTKMPGAAEFVESTAVIKLNNETITAKSYEWTVKNCSFDSKIGTNTATIRITDIDEASDSATATCEAIYVDNVGNEVPLTKVFSISKIKQGRSLYKLDLSNEFVTIPAVDDGKGNIKIADDYDWDYLTSHTVNAYYGDEILKVTCSRKTPSSSASEKTFHLKYTVSDTLSLNSEINQSTAAEGATFVLANLTGKTGTILYELFRGSKKVASAKFEATRLDSGTPATSYWLNISSPIHTGVRQESDIKIQPKLETGNSGQDNDILAYIRCKYVGETSYIEVSKNINTGEVTLTTPLKDKNILVEASHTEDFSNIYESETITFSPLNTPVIDLTNDSAALTYTAGGLKINKEEGKEDIVESTATLYLNGKPVEGVTYSWTYTDCIIEGTTNSQTIKIKGLLAPKGTATCSVSYWGETFTKVFSITKQIQGEASTSYWLKTSCVVHTGTNQEKAIEATAMKKVGEETEEPDTTAKLYYRYYNDENWIGGDHILKIENYKDEDLYIVASHKESFSPDKTLEQTDSDIYDWETITFSPLNTPVLDLTNDSDSLTYNAENNKIEVPGQTASVTSTAALYLNGDEVSGATYNWTVEGCSTTDYTVSSNNKTITINAIAEDSLNVKATCTATHNGKTYSKVFSVVKQVIATTYWLKVSHPVHAGINQTEPIRIVAMKKEGTSAETLDTTAYLWYKYKDATTWTKAEGSSAYVLNINSGWEDKDLTIFASHNDKIFTNEEVTETSTEIYDWEVITFSPLNTPAINLTNDTASLVYNYDDTKYSNDVVSTTAELYLNGEKINETNLSFSWADTTTDAEGNRVTAITFKGDTNKAKIKVEAISAPAATATCSITVSDQGIDGTGQFAGKTYTKDFTIAKQIKGDPTTSYWIAPSTKIIKINADNTIATDTIEFQIIKKSGTKTPEAITLTSGESLKLKVGINGQTLNDFNEKATDNIYSVDTAGVSTSITIALYDNDTEIDRETISVVKDGKPGEDGEDGKSAYKIDIANDFVTIPTDYSGTIQLNTDALKALTTHTVTLYYGEEAIKPNWISSQTPNSTMGLRYTISTGLTATIPASSSEDNTISVENITALTTDTGSILYEIVKDEKVLASAKFEASKIKSGEPTTYYRLEVSSSTVVRHSDGTRTPTGIDIYCYKYTGSTKTQVKDFYLIYTKDSHVPQTLQAVDPAINPNATYPGYIHMGTGGLENQLILELCLKDPGNVSDYQYDAPVLDKETVLAIYDGVDGAGGDTFEVQQAFLWTSDYTYMPELPNSSLSSTKTDWSNSKEWAFISTKYITKEQLDKNTPTWKLIFISTRVKTTSAAGEESYSPWDAPAIYLCKNEDSYRRETTAEGLFGQGQGIYYTVINTVKNAAGTADRFTAGKPYDPKELAAYVTEDPDNNKGNVTVYINAEYIKTGALTIGDKNNYIFKADIGTPEVEIGGWNVEEDKLYSGNSTKRVALQSSLINDSFVECIVSDGTQYIDTGLYVNYNTDIVEVTYQPTTYDQNGMIFGQWNDATTSQAALYLYKDGKAINFYIPFDGEQKALNTYINYTNLSKQTVRIQKESSGNQLTIYVNDRATSFETYINSLPVATVTSYIASGRRNDGSANWGFKGKIYSCKIWRNGSLIRNYAPYYKANTQTYGLFDLCNNTFTSSGNGYKFDGEYSSIYLGSEESRTAPFSVSNTGHVRASDVSLEGHIISDGGRIGGFTISDSSFTNGVLGQNDFVAIASKDSLSYRVANITDEYKLIVGPSFGVTKTGAVNIANGKFTGEVNAEGGKFSSIESIECLNSLKIGPIELTPFNFNTADIKEKDITFTVTGGRASYIGSSTIYYVTITASQKLAKAIQLPYMLVYATYTGTYGGTSSYNNKVQNIYFNQKITFPANTTTYEISIIADSYDQYGSWRFNDVQVNQIGAVVSAWNSSSNSFVCKASVNTTTESWALKFSQNLVPTSTAAKLSLGVSNQAWDKLYCNSAYAETFYASSDLRLKENIKEFSPQKSILDLPVVEFDFKDSGKHQIGCIAQDLQKLFPELVETKDNGYLTIAENKLVYLLLLEVKKLNAKIESLSTNNKSKGELKQYD